MSRELAGVIACMQQIEIACRQLDEQEAQTNSLKEVHQATMAFFKQASVEKARQVLYLLRENEAVPDFRVLYERPLDVDGLNTNIGELADELADVLTDFDE